MCNIATLPPPHVIQPLDVAPPCCHSFWNSYPFHEHSVPAEEDAEDSIVEQVTREVFDLLSVEPALECGGLHYRRRLTSVLKQTQKLENLHIAYLISVLGCKLNALELHHDAEQLHRRALCMGVKRLGRDHPDLIGSIQWLAFSLYCQAQFKEAVLLCYSMIVLVHQTVGALHPDLANCYFNLAMIVEAMGLEDHAAVLREKGFSLLKLFFPLHQQQAYSYWWPLLNGGIKGEYGKVGEGFWNYDAVPYGFYPHLEMHPGGVWIPAVGYSYGAADSGLVPGPAVHSF